MRVTPHSEFSAELKWLYTSRCLGPSRLYTSNFNDLPPSMSDFAIEFLPLLIFLVILRSLIPNLLDYSLLSGRLIEVPSFRQIVPTLLTLFYLPLFIIHDVLIVFFIIQFILAYYRVWVVLRLERRVKVLFWKRFSDEFERRNIVDSILWNQRSSDTQVRFQVIFLDDAQKSWMFLAF